MSRRDADLSWEAELAQQYQATVVVGMDEVGRGALAGPVCVGAVAITDFSIPVPVGLTDSKLLSAARRYELDRLVSAWARSCAVGQASAQEIDEFGIMGALCLAGRRALAKIQDELKCVDLVVLDGNYDWLNKATGVAAKVESELALWPQHDEQTGLVGDMQAVHVVRSGSNAQADEIMRLDGARPYRVVTRVKADVSHASVAAASVIAKCYRDDLMTNLAHQYPQFGWENNKGYASASHRAAIRSVGACQQHRRSWNLSS